MDTLFSLLQKTTPKLNTTYLIGIDGHGGSGKSSLSHILSSTLGAEIIHVDDFATWDQTHPWHERLIAEVITPIQNGATSVSYEKTSWWDDHHPLPAKDQPVTSVMILEGVGALRQELRPYISIGIFVDTPRKICLERGITRDLATEKSRQEIEDLWYRWRTGEDIYIKTHKPHGYAHLILDGARPFEGQL